MAVKPALGFIIIDFVSPQFKYRINAFNIYYNTQHLELRYIFGKADAILKDKNTQLKRRFESFLNNGKTQNLVTDDHEEVEPECPLCMEKLHDNTNVRNAINQHMETEHKILHPESNNPVCGFCKKDFKSIHDVIYHIQQDHQHKIVS